MTNLRKLVSVNDVKFLRDLYRENSPNSTHAFYILSNFIQWFEKNPQIEHVHIYVLDNWRESGFFIILVRALSGGSHRFALKFISKSFRFVLFLYNCKKDRYQLFINVLNYNEEEVAQALKQWDWSRKYKIFALPSFLFPVVEKTLRETNMNIRMTTLKIYERQMSFMNAKETIK